MATIRCKPPGTVETVVFYSTLQRGWLKVWFYWHGCLLRACCDKKMLRANSVIVHSFQTLKTMCRTTAHELMLTDHRSQCSLHGIVGMLRCTCDCYCLPSYGTNPTTPK